jgi:hypothetical protein
MKVHILIPGREQMFGPDDPDSILCLGQLQNERWNGSPSSEMRNIGTIFNRDMMSGIFVLSLS